MKQGDTKEPEGTSRLTEVECGSVWCCLTRAALKHSVNRQLAAKYTDR